MTEAEAEARPLAEVGPQAHTTLHLTIAEMMQNTIAGLGFDYCTSCTHRLNKVHGGLNNPDALNHDLYVGENADRIGDSTRRRERRA